MKSIVLRKEIEPLPIRSVKELAGGYEGILNSTYKAAAQRNLDNVDPNSIFGIRQRIKAHQYKAVSETGTLLKLAVIIIALSLGIFL